MSNVFQFDEEAGLTNEGGKVVCMVVILEGNGGKGKENDNVGAFRFFSR